MHAHTQACIRMCTFISISSRSQIRLLLLSKPAVKSSIICIYQLCTAGGIFTPNWSGKHSALLSFLITATHFFDNSFVLSDKQFLLRPSVTKARSQFILNCARRASDRHARTASTQTHTHANTHTVSRIDGDRSGGEGSPDYWTTCSGENRGKSIIAAF